MKAATSSSLTGTPVYFECVDFLNLEAELLDDNRIREWFDRLVHPSIDYRVPIRVTRARSEGSGFSFKGFHMIDDHGSLEARVSRLETEYAWAEDPPSRTRRLVTNVRVTSDKDGSSGAVEVMSNLLVYRSRYDAATYNILAGERHDTLLRVSQGMQLVKRLVLLDQTTLGTHNLAIFL
jgi:3-phenylpropionate/cinnamic acid dioxygenase small subunit